MKIDNRNIGFIGLGIMGKPMALDLINAGYILHIHNRSQLAFEDMVIFSLLHVRPVHSVSKQRLNPKHSLR